MPIDHYENFPVASLLLPRSLQEPVGRVYWFARSADDIADEGDADALTRIASLSDYERQLDRTEKLEPLDVSLQPDRFAALGELIRDWPLSIQHFYDLLSAFKQDVTVKRYDSYDGVLDYCNRSANPVGRLMLELYRRSTPDLVRKSDAICTSLQLINFLQDVEIDARKGRIYLPLEDLRRFGVDEQQVLSGTGGTKWQDLMRFECERSRRLMLSGASLVHALPGRIGLELRLVVQGGLRILERIQAVDFDVYHQRPTLGRADWLRVIGRAFVMPREVA